MTRKTDTMIPDPLADPFGELSPGMVREDLQLLGGRVPIQSNSSHLLRLVDSAYAGLAGHRLSTVVPRLCVRLLLKPGARAHGRRPGEPPPPIAMFSGGGFLGGATPSSNFVVVSPRERGGARRRNVASGAFFVPCPL